MRLCVLPGKAVFKITYTVSSVTLSPTHSLDHCRANILGWFRKSE